MQIRDLKQLVQTSPGDARITVEVNKFRNTQAKVGLTGTDRFAAWVKDRKEYVAQNQNARKELAITLRETYGESFDTGRLKTLGNRALTTSQLATWIERGEKHLERTGRKNAETARATLKTFDAALQQVRKSEGFSAPIHPRLLQAAKSVVEHAISSQSTKLPPMKRETADRLQLDILKSLVAGLKTPEMDRTGLSLFKGQPVLQRLVGFAKSSPLDGAELTEAMRYLAAKPFNKHTEVHPEVYSRAVTSASHISDFIHYTDFSDAKDLIGAMNALMGDIKAEIDKGGARDLRTPNKPGAVLDNEGIATFRRTAEDIAFSRLTSEDVTRLVVALNSTAVKDLRGLIAGMREGFASGRTYVEFTQTTENLAVRVNDMLESIARFVEGHPASGGFTLEGLAITEFRTLDSVPDRLWREVIDVMGFEPGVLKQHATD